ncbi:MAG: hypothetical protein JRG94_23730 [Deltaproteobacteria bacterium]|nr:hypothetical protein [Deltaproteobacteria bacterium]
MKRPRDSRSPLAKGAAEAAAEAAMGYSDLELDLETGRRGNRLAELAAKLCLLSGAEAATVVNNNAAAVARRRPPGRGRNHQPHPCSRLRAGDRTRYRAAAQDSSQ